MDTSTSLDYDHHYNEPNEDIDTITFGFNQKLDLEDIDLHSRNDDVHEQHDNDDHNEDEYDDDDFTFMLVAEDDEPIDTDKAFEDGQIFPLFDQKLLLNGEYDIEQIDRLPIRPSVDIVFIESPRGFPSTSAHHDEDTAAGPYCAWSKDLASSSSSTSSSSNSGTELSKKCNSTGFSKLWRLKEKVGRSNSDGRDAFVFLKHSDRTTTTTTTTTSKATSGDGIFVKIKGVGGKPRVVKAKKTTVSAHEAYIKSRSGHTEEERRKSYLPYRPELMGFFTNVHGGLSKNVHPY